MTMQRHRITYLVNEASRECEEQIRAKAIVVLQDIGVVCQLPQSTIYKAGVLLHRFLWCRGVDFNDCDYTIDEAAQAALLLSSKLDDREKSVFCIVNTWVCISGETVPFNSNKMMFSSDKEFTAKRAAIVSAERDLLEEVGYHISVEDPYKYIVFYTKEVLLEEHELIQSSWTYLNDSLLTDACCHHPTHHLAIGALFLALRKHNRKYPDMWWESFSITTNELIDVVKQMAKCYLIAKSLKSEDISRWSSTP